MAYATWGDVERRFSRDLTERERIQVTEWLDDVESSILNRIPDLADLIDSGALSERTVVKVESQAVIRKLDNPQGKLTERIDDYSWTRAQSTATGELELTDAEWEELTPSASSDAFTIRPHYEPGWCGTTGVLGWHP